MSQGTVIKYNKNRKYSVILPDEWKSQRTDVLFLSSSFDTKLGERVEYICKEINGKRYAEEIKKLDT